MNIIKSSAAIKADKTRLSSLETECLFGEKVQILEVYSEMVYCKLLNDNYYGWVKKSSLGKIKKLTHRVIVNRTFVYKDSNPKSDTLLYLPLGSKLSINKIKSGWAETSFSINKKIKLGYVPSRHIVKIEHKLNDWVTIAEQLEGTPYKWGGRDTVGIDCSALLQLSYETYGHKIPRNTSQQIKLNKEEINTIYDLKRGCVIFWEGHVGIMVDNLNCIHANSFHMMTVTEPLRDILDRMKIDFKIIKMMNFN